MCGFWNPTGLIHPESGVATTTRIRRRTHEPLLVAGALTSIRARVPPTRSSPHHMLANGAEAHRGFTLCSIPSVLVAALLEQGIRNLEVVSDNRGVDDAGLPLLAARCRIRRAVTSYVGGEPSCGPAPCPPKLSVNAVADRSSLHDESSPPTRHRAAPPRRSRMASTGAPVLRESAWPGAARSPASRSHVPRWPPCRTAAPSFRATTRQPLSQSPLTPTIHSVGRSRRLSFAIRPSA